MANHAPSTEHPLALPAAALTAIVLGIALARARCVRERRACARDAARDAECIELSDSEVANAQRVGSLSTVNVYRGELGGPALAHLKASVQATLDANPWLAGRLAPSERSGAAVALYVPRGASASDVFVEAKAPQLTVDLPYHQLCELTGCHAVDRGVQAGPLGRTRGSVFKVTVLRGEGGARVGCTALCVSMSHTIADAYTFYKIYRMLAGTEPVASLDVVRRPHRLPRGHARMAWVQAGPLAAFHLDARLRPGIEISPLALDAEVTRKSKAAHLPTPDVPFVSSTDVHVSQLCRALAPDAAIVKARRARARSGARKRVLERARQRGMPAPLAPAPSLRRNDPPPLLPPVSYTHLTLPTKRIV